MHESFFYNHVGKGASEEEAGAHTINRLHSVLTEMQDVSAKLSND
jgi:hypothetical protein